MNIPSACNAFWDGADGELLPLGDGAGCRNTGEIAAIFDHEWGHGMDDNGTNPNIAGPGEAIADIYAALRLNTSCIGRGFFLDETCGGYGDACDGTPANGLHGRPRHRLPQPPLRRAAHDHVDPERLHRRPVRRSGRRSGLPRGRLRRPLRP